MKHTLTLLTALLLAPLAALHATEPVTAQARWENSELIYEQPATSPDAGQPIGNGRMETMAWTAPEAIHLQINRVDVFAVNRDHLGKQASATDYCGGIAGVVVHVGGQPFAPGGKSFRQRLSLANAEDFWGVGDSIMDLAAIRGTAPLAIRSAEILEVDAELIGRWKELLVNVAPYPMGAQLKQRSDTVYRIPESLCHSFMTQKRTLNEPGYDDFYPDKGAVCLAVLRRDGFVSLDAGEKPGTLLTKPFVLAGTTLHVNVDAKAGELGVTVLGGDGQTVAVSEPVTGDQPRAALRWKSGDSDSFKVNTVSLRLSLRKARLYSFWSE